MTRRLVSYVAVAYLLAVTLPFTAHAATQSATTAKSAEHHSSTHHSSKPATPKVDLNKASETELATLPGVDAATAAKIVSMRPYKSANQVVAKGILTKEQFATIEHHVTASQPKSEAKTAEKSTAKEAPKAAGSTEGSTTK
jgi:DNA uptake protein ComE-like DNA-binding protein